MDNLEERLELTRWDNQFPKAHFDLLTIHSLLIDTHPKFQQLKQIIVNFNQEPCPNRIRYQQPFVSQLFKMLSQLTRLQTTEEQLAFLEKVHSWATATKSFGSQLGPSGSKSRPTTASTRTRPTTAHSRPQTGISRPGTIKENSKKETIEMKRGNPIVDYDKLKEGEHQFYANIRSLHPQIDPPKKRLREFERVKLAEDDPESDIEIIELDKQQIQKPVEVEENFPQQQEEILGEEAEGDVEGDAVQGDVNVDDIPLEGDDQGVAEPEEEKQVIDKLRPKQKAYGEPENVNISKKHLQGGLNQLQADRQARERKVLEDKGIAQFQAEWAQFKGRAKSAINRRAESAKIVSRMVGIPTKRYQQQKQQLNVINFQNVLPAEIKPKGTRPITAFSSDRLKVRQELIKNSLMVGKLTGHIDTNQTNLANQQGRTLKSMTAIGAKPKHKNFEEILRAAEERVVRESQQQVMEVKQSLVRDKVSLGLGKIVKSISYQQRQLAEEWCGVVTGMGMPKNPFIKVAKKKKKKKKAK